MARFDEWMAQILEAQKQWEQIPDEIGKVSVSVYILEALSRIDDARRFLDSVARNKKTDRQKRDCQLRAIRQYLLRDLPSRQESQRLAADLRLAKHLLRERKYQEKLAARLAMAGMTLEHLNSNKVPVKPHSKVAVMSLASGTQNQNQKLVGDVQGGTDPIEQMKAAMGGYYKKD